MLKKPTLVGTRFPETVEYSLVLVADELNLLRSGLLRVNVFSLVEGFVGFCVTVLQQHLLPHVKTSPVLFFPERRATYANGASGPVEAQVGGQRLTPTDGVYPSVFVL